jgi:hypothetical protein
LGKEERPVEAIIYVGNAGLVLTGSFLPIFFETLEMTEKGDGVTRWKTQSAAARAVHFLQYLVDGRTSTPEPTLVLNKIMCGLDLGTPVERSIEITDREREVSEQLLKAMIANWQIIAHSSITALQETFFQREGKLEKRENKWELRVQRRALDVLVDQIPWSFSVIRLPWMPLPLYVTW